MKNDYTKPASHRTFQFGDVTIDSDFDSGNCSHAEQVSATAVCLCRVSLMFGLVSIMLKINIELGFILLFRASNPPPSLLLLKINKIR
jgi:hypothetical protein